MNSSRVLTEVRQCRQDDEMGQSRLVFIVEVDTVRTVFTFVVLSEKI